MNTKAIIDELLPLYRSLYNDCTNIVNFDDFVVFFLQLGRMYFDNARDGILFVGRATNGGRNVLSENLEDVADFQFESSMLNNEVQRYWSVPNPEGGCRFSKSAFWRIISRVSQQFYPKDWSRHIAWTNLYKVAPAKGYNPSNQVCYAQLEACDAILNKEIEILSPKYVIFLTSWNWLKDFSVSETMPKDVQQIAPAEWDRYVSKKWCADGITFILSEHPMGKPETPHTKALLKLMRAERAGLAVSV